MVARGFLQQASVDYFDSFFPVIKSTTIRVVITITLYEEWIVRQIDINNTFLNGELLGEVYMY